MIVRRNALLVLALCSLLLAACAQPAPTATPSPTEEATALPSPTPQPTRDPNVPIPGGEIVIGVLQEPSTLNPLLASSPVEHALAALSVEGLLQLDANGQYIPALAKKLPAVSADGLAITYTLEPDVEFSNGAAFGCADVRFTYQAIMSSSLPLERSGYELIGGVTCQDEHTAIITFSQVYPAYLELFAYVIPKDSGDPTEMEDWLLSRVPTGTGPWQFKEWERGDHITYLENPTYREAADDKPYLERITLRFLDDRQAGLQRLGSGEIDVLWGLGQADVPALFALKDKDTRYVTAPTGRHTLLVLNLANPLLDAPANPASTPHPILSDPKVRQAIQLGIDRQLLVDFLLYGQVSPASALLPAGPFACRQEPSLYDPQAARDLLDEAGWTLRQGGDGIRVKAGRPLRLTIQTIAGDPLLEDTQRILVEMMKAIGIALEIDSLPAGELFAGWDANDISHHGRFDILLYTDGPGIDPGDYLYEHFHSSRLPTARNRGAGSNYARYVNAEVDAWLDQAAGLADLDQRQDLYCKAARQISADLPHILLYEQVLASGYRAHLKEFRPLPGPHGLLGDSAAWWLTSSIPPTPTPAPTLTPLPDTLTPSVTSTPEPAAPSPLGQLPLVPIAGGAVGLLLIVVLIVVLVRRRRARPSAEPEQIDLGSRLEGL